MNQSRTALTILAGVLAIVLIVILFSIYLALRGGDSTAEQLDAGAVSGQIPAAESLTPSAMTLPGPSTVVAADPAATFGNQVHIVKPGETLYRISSFYSLTGDDIISANELADPEIVVAGQELLIPVVAANRLMTSPTSPAPPSNTPLPTTAWTPTEPPPPTATPQRVVNTLPLETYLIMSEEVTANAQAIFARGQELGRYPQAYSKVGDSTIENPHFMARFDEGSFNLGEYGHLQEVIDYFAGSHGRQGMAVKRGFHSWTINDPMWADKRFCQANETPLACEIRLHNPGVMIFRLGSNDRGVPAGFEENVRQLVQYAIDNGIVPILGTKADRFEGSNINNDIIRQLAAELQVPLWDFDRVAQTVPGRGLDTGGVHLTVYYAHDYTSPAAFTRGHGLHNLTALLVLDAVWREIIQADG
jgi:LysM repeat protein